MLPSDYVVASLATRMFNEPPDDALLGYTLCGLVIRNRVLAGWMGGQWLSLILDHDKYSANPPTAARALKLGDPVHDTMFRRVLATAQNIYDGKEQDISEGALWYGRLNECSEDFKIKIVRDFTNHPMIGQVGRNSLFK